MQFEGAADGKIFRNWDLAQNYRISRAIPQFDRSARRAARRRLARRSAVAPAQRRGVARSAARAARCGSGLPRRRASTISPPPILQWFESSYRTIEDAHRRTCSWRATASCGCRRRSAPTQGDLSVGYDVYDRFDLGRPGTADAVRHRRRPARRSRATLHRAGLEPARRLRHEPQRLLEPGHAGFAGRRRLSGIRHHAAERHRRRLPLRLRRRRSSTSGWPA